MNPRSESRRSAFRAAVLALHGPTCQMPICRMASRAIDLSLRAPHPGSYTADHVKPLIDGGQPFDPRNGRPAHWGCNSSAGASLANGRRPPGPSRDW